MKTPQLFALGSLLWIGYILHTPTRGFAYLSRNCLFLEAEIADEARSNERDNTNYPSSTKSAASGNNNDGCGKYIPIWHDFSSFA
jgi:hypothetical protein